jgi:hypothetical protein
MKYLLSLAVIMLTAISGKAQSAPTEEQTQNIAAIIYTSDNLSDEIQKLCDARDQRSFAGSLYNSSLDAAKGIGGGYVTSFVNLGVNAVASLFTRSSRLQQEWEKTVASENSWSTQVSTIQEVNDFYKKSSTSGALDPKDMTFDGIGCIRMEGKDTVFYISCHINQAKLNRIVDHSKFELVLDTLKISPMHSHLPNTQLPIEFSYSERKNFTLNLNIKLYSSWFTENTALNNNTQLGEFTITIPVEENDLKNEGYLYYVRKDDEVSKYKVVGESFIVPRSYMGYRDGDDYTNIWGTGQYKLDITISESCDITDEYRKNWKNDRKERSKMQPRDGFWAKTWKTVTKQDWDDISKQWVITTLTAPAGVLSNELIDKMGLKSGGSASATSSQVATPAAAQGAPR